MNGMEYDEYMDKECIPVCDALNELPDVRTFESCCGHLKRRYVVYLYTDNPYSMAVIARALDGRYLPTKSTWKVTIETIDVERIPQFCIGVYSEEPFKDYDMMMQDVNEVVDSIRYWAQPEFYEHFKFNKYNKKDKEYPDLTHDRIYKFYVEHCYNCNDECCCGAYDVELRESCKLYKKEFCE